MFGLEYMIVKNDKKSWTDAQADCVQRGFNLTSVLNENEASFLLNYAYLLCFNFCQFLGS